MIWEQGKDYRFLRINAGTAEADTVDLGEERPAGAAAWMYFAGGGDDTVTAKAGDIVYGDAGADTINVTGNYAEVHGGSDNDTITIRALDGQNRHHTVVRGDSGNDKIDAYGSYHYINGGADNDEIHICSDENSEVESHNNAVSGSRGEDKIYVHAGFNHRVNGGADNDTIYILGGNNNRANGGDGNDALYANAGNGHRLNGGAGDDTFTVDNGNNIFLMGGEGSDKYIVNTEFTNETGLIVNQSGFEDGDEDTLQLTNVNKGDVDYALADGTLTISHTSGGTVTVEGWWDNPLAQIQFADQTVTADDINEAVSVTVSQKGVLKRFMKSLDNYTVLARSWEDGVAALDVAVNTASNGKYGTWDSLVESFISDVRTYAVKDDPSADDYTYHGVDAYGYGTDIEPESGLDRFLKNYCGIDLTNEDTGSIIGSDAGGAEVKSPISIVPESGTTTALQSPPSGITTINGLTLHWPNVGDDATKKYIIDSLYTWWSEEGLNLIDEAYGLSFMENSVTGKDMTVEFVDVDESFMAKVESDYDYRYTGSGDNFEIISENTALTMKINMKHFADIDVTDPSGYAGPSSGYLDRTIAHEFTHAVMAATMERVNGFLPLYVREGLAELVHGIDDFRPINIISLARSINAEHLTEVLQPNMLAGADTYAAGYMLLRYFAKQVADTGNGHVVNELPNVIATPPTDIVGEASSSMLLSGNAMTVSDCAESSLAIASIQNSLIDFADSGVSDSMYGVQQEDKQNSSLFITGNV